MTFRAILDRLRADLATRYVRDTSMPLSQVAWRLGYKDPSAFIVAFKRWTGKTPSPCDGNTDPEPGGRDRREGYSLRGNCEPHEPLATLQPSKRDGSRSAEIQGVSAEASFCRSVLRKSSSGLPRQSPK